MLSRKYKNKLKSTSLTRLTKKSTRKPSNMFFKKMSLVDKKKFVIAANESNKSISLLGFYKDLNPKIETIMNKFKANETIPKTLAGWNYYETKNYDILGDNMKYRLFHQKFNSNQECDLVIIPGFTAKSCHFMFARFLLMLKIIKELQKQNKTKLNYNLIPYDNVYVINFDGLKDIIKNHKEQRDLCENINSKNVLDIILNLGISNCNLFAKSAGGGVALTILDSIVIKGAMLFCPGGNKQLFNNYLTTVKPGVMQKPIYMFWSLNDNKIPIINGYNIIKSAKQKKPKYSMIKLVEINTNDDLDDTNHRIHLHAIPYLMAKDFRNMMN
jgi:hypothetical protein